MAERQLRNRSVPVIGAGVEENELTLVEINNQCQDIPNASSDIILRQSDKELVDGNDYPLG
jgi:hypothetical protein